MEFGVLVVLVLALAGTWTFSVDFLGHAVQLSLSKFLVAMLIILIGFSYPRLPVFFSRNSHKEARILLLWLIGWMVWMAFSSNWSPNSVVKSSTWEGFLVLALMAVYFSLVWDTLSEASKNRVIGAALFAALFVFFVAIFHRSEEFDRLVFPGTGPITFSRLMVVGLVVAIYLGSVYGTNLVLSTPVFFISGVMLAGSRGVLLALLLTAVFAAVAFRLAGGRLNQRQRIIGFTVSSFWAILWIGFELMARLGSPVEAINRYSSIPINFGAGRELLYPLAWRVFLDNPVNGVGLNGFRDSVDSEFPGLYPAGEMYVHNIVLATLAEGGLIGAVLLVGFCISFLVAIWRWLLLGRVLLFSVLATFFFLQSLLSGDYYDSRLFWLFALLAALEIPRDGKQPILPRSRPPSKPGESAR